MYSLMRMVNDAEEHVTIESCHETEKPGSGSSPGSESDSGSNGPGPGSQDNGPGQAQSGTDEGGPGI